MPGEGEGWDVFVSYSRRDVELAGRLADALGRAGHRCWIDTNDIRASADWMDEIEAAIDATLAFVFVVSPDSAASSVCRRELEHALSGNKRILPVVAREPGDAEVPPEVARRNWIFLRPEDDFEAGVRQLQSALETEPEWAATHTRLLVRAREWKQSERDSSFLLRGSDLRAAEDWLARNDERKDPQPTALHTEHVIASRRAATRGQRIRTAVLGAGLVVAAVLTLIAISQRNRAEDQARVARSGELAARALLTAKTQPFDGLAIAAEAARTEPTSQATQALRQTLQQTSSTIAVIRGDGSKVNAVALSEGPSGDLVAVAADQGSVTLWSPDGDAVSELDTGAESVRSVSFSADGHLLAVALGTAGIQVWDVESERLEKRIPTERAVYSVALSPDGRSVAAGGVGGAAVWRIDGGGPTELRGRGKLVYSVAFSPDGELVAAGGISGVAEVFRARDGHPVRTLDVSAEAGNRVDVNGVRFSPDGGLIATADGGGRAIVWDLRDGSVVSSVRASKDELTSAVLDENESHLLTAGFDNDAKLWELGGDGATLLTSFKGHEGATSNGELSGDGDLAVTGSADGTVRTWDANPDDAIAKIRSGPAIAVAYDPSGEVVMTTGVELQLWDSEGRRIGNLDLPPRVEFGLDAEFNEDGSLLVSTDFGSRPEVRLWDVEAGRQLLSLPAPRGTSPQGAEIVPGDREIVSAYDDGSIVVSDAESGEEIRRFEAPSTIRTIDLSPDGTLLAAGSDEGPIWIFDLDDGGMVATLEGHTDYVGNVRFNADGTRLVSASDDRTAIVWDVESGRAVTTLTGHTGPVSDVDFSPDSSLVVTSSQDHSVRVWNAADGEQIEILDGFPHFVYGVDYSPDGSSIVASGAYTDVARIFECGLCAAPDELLSQAEERLDATLTPEQRAGALSG